MRKRFYPLLTLVVVMAGCTASQYPQGDCQNYYPELPDNEYCFRKIAEYHDFSNSKIWTKTGSGKKIDGQDFSAWSVNYTIEGYLGILEGRGAIRKRQIVLNSRQATAIFKSSPVLPDFLIEVIGTYDQEPSQYRILTVYYKPENEEKVNAWLEKLVPPGTRPRENAENVSI